MPLSTKQKLAIAKRDRTVLELKSRGMTFEQIAKSGIDGVSHAQQAKVCFDRGMKNIIQVAAEQYRALENEKLDLIERNIIPMITDNTKDDSTRQKAATVLLNALARRAKLNGIDAQATDEAAGAIRTVFVSSEVLTKTVRADDEV